jgi:hypothetical protein
MTFAQDTNETPVLFRRSRRKEPEGLAAEVTAVFPCEPSDYLGRAMTCYAHVGQHGSCNLGWYHTTRAATPEEYADLKRELESAPYGYRLKVYKRMQRSHHQARASELQNMKVRA